MLQLAILDTPDGNLIGDYSSRASGVKASTGEHGFEALTFNIAMSLSEAFRLYDRAGLPHVVLSDGTMTLFEGRLEDVAIIDGGVRCQALGYWRALADVPYSALWSDAGVSAWRPITSAEVANREPARWQMDTNNRLYLAPQKNGLFGSPNYYVGSLTYETPIGGARKIVTVTFTYDLKAPAGWRADLGSFNRDFSGNLVPWTLTATGVQQTGTTTVTLATPNDRLAFSLANLNAAAAYTGETGDAYLKITGLRVKTTATATVRISEIAAALATYVNGINPSQLSADGGLLADQGLDLTDEVYEDALPSDILTRLARLGDDQTPPRRWEVGVWENRRLHLRVRGSAGRAWYVDATGLEVERTLEQLANSVYARYQDASNRGQRSAVAADANSVSRYGLTRRAAIGAQTTSASQAAVQRDAYLADNAQPIPRAQLAFDALYDAAGGRWPLWMARSGDTICIRNLPPTLSADVDRIRTFRVSRTSYDVDRNVLTVEPESPLPTLEVLLSRQAERLPK
jgi:hypothetical protein